MVENQVATKPGINTLALTIIAVIVVAAIFGAFLSLLSPDFISSLSGGNYVSGGAIYDAIYVVLTIAADTLYLDAVASGKQPGSFCRLPHTGDIQQLS